MIRHAGVTCHQLATALREARSVSSFRSARFGGAKSRFRSRATFIMRRFIAGAMTQEVAAERFSDAYREAAREGMTVGLAKGGADFTAAELALLDREVTRISDKFVGFLRDVRTAGFVAGEVDTVFPGGVNARLRLYTDRVDGVRNDAWMRANSGRGVLWWWRLSAGDICDDCITLHLMSPFRVEAPTVPRMGGTVCGARCRCTLVMTTGGTPP